MAIYQDVVSRVTQTEADWKAVCRLAGRIYRYEFDNVLMVYARQAAYRSPLLEYRALLAL